MHCCSLWLKCLNHLSHLNVWLDSVPQKLTHAFVSARRCEVFLWVSVCVWLCWSYQKLVMPHQCARIRRDEKQALWLVCGSNKPDSHTLDWVGKKRKLYCFCQSDTRTKPQRILYLPPALYVKQLSGVTFKNFFFLVSLGLFSLTQPKYSG